MSIAFVAQYGPTSTNTVTPKTVSPTVANGDVLAIAGWQETGSFNLTTPSGGGYTYTAAVSKIASTSSEALQSWTSFPNSAQSYTLTDTWPGATSRWGFTAYRFTGVSSIGATASGSSSAIAPAVYNITTTAAHSAIVMLMYREDGRGSTETLTYKTVDAGTFTEATNQFNSFHNQIYMGYYLDSGSVGTKSIGATNTDMAWTSIAIELVPSAGAQIKPEIIQSTAALVHSTVF